MPDDYTRRTPRMTPIPTADLSALTASVARTEENVKVIKDTLIPPLVDEARDARNVAHDADMRINSHIDDKNAHVHVCAERERQQRQDITITDIATKVQVAFEKVVSSSKLTWWVLGIFVTVIGIGVSFAVTVEGNVVRNTTTLETHDKTIIDHNNAIKVLVDTQNQDRKLYLQEVKNIPIKITKILEDSDNSSDVDAAIRDLPLTSQEERLISDIVDNARRRATKGSNEVP